VTQDDFLSAFDAHQDAVYRFLWRMAGPDDAEDLAQEVFLSLLRHPTRFDPARGTLRAFLLGIARNLALKRFRDENRWTALDDADLAAPPFDVTRRETAEEVAAAIRALPPLQREVIILIQYEELSLDETARIVASEVGTVKSRLHRARQNLRRALSPVVDGVKRHKVEVGR
jgi:RNA polymerase sigma-70 factor (ECF subfamily)